RDKLLSLSLLVLLITVSVNDTDSGSQLDATTIDPSENSTMMIMIDLDEMLAVVNKSETIAPTGVPIINSGNGYGDRVFMHAINNNFNKDDLMGRTLRLVVPKIEPPYVNYVNFSDAEVIKRGYGPGVVIEILKEMQNRLNLTYEVVPFNESQWGALENGNWTGAFGMMYRKEADILVGGAIMQYDRGLITDLTFPFQYAPTAMLIRSPEKFNDNTWLIVTAPFSWEVWMLIGISILASGVILYVLVRFLTCANEVQFSMVESIWVFFAISVQQGLPVQPRSWSCRIMISLWWLASITIMAMFTGSLVALFAVDKTSLPFYNFNQLVSLVQRGYWRIVMDGTTTTRTNMIRESESPVYKTLWYEMSVNRKVTYVKGTEAGVEYILANGNNVLLGPEDSLKFWATVDCRLYKLDEGILPTYLSIPFAKDSDYSTYASNLIRDMVERGFVEKWIHDYTSFMATKKGGNKCSTTTKAADKYLDLSKAQGAFWVLIGGFGIGASLFMAELVYKGIRMLWKYYRNETKYDVAMRKFEMERKSTEEKKHTFSSNTTSSITSSNSTSTTRSGDSGYSPEIKQNLNDEHPDGRTRF
ncbi:hypothetical protein PMAYCL1PPCAC_31425, partial [Pristionchus mayeri]